MEVQVTYKELKWLSQEFRTFASRLMNSKEAQARDNLQRLMDFIDNKPIILNFIENCKKCSGLEIAVSDYEVCRHLTPIPQSTEGEVAFTYMLFKYALSLDKNETDYISFAYCFLSEYYDTVPVKFQACVETFAQMTIFPFVTHINNHIKKLIIYMNKEDKYTTSVSIGSNYGQFNMAQDQACISAINVAFEQANNFTQLAQELLNSLKQDSLISLEEREVIQDTLEVTIQQVQANAPKVGLLKSTLDRIKRIPELVRSASTTAESATKLVTTSEGVIVALEHLIHTIQHLH